MSGNFRPPLPGYKPKPQSPTSDPRQFIRDFSFHNCKLGNQGFQRLLIQVFGYAGHGKSSFINTCKIVWENSSYNNYTKASGSQGGDTMDRRTYQLTENIILVDNRGCSAMKSHEKGEIFAQLANLMPLNMKVDWCQGFKLADRIVEAEPLVQPSDFISPIFVYSIGHAPNPDEKQELKEILKTCREMTGVEAIVLLTHKSKGNLERAEAMFKDMGAKHVFSLENYTPKNQSRSMEVHNSVMKFLYEVVQDAKFRVDYTRDPQKEMTERKIFVLNYIHNKGVEAHIQKLEGQKAAENASMERTMRVKTEEADKQKQKDQKEHEEKIRQLEAEFERQRLRDQFEHEQRMEKLQRGRKKK
ncbi:uncharacterized protein LOC120942564 [Rana temporaria]|uniref:uncharacterized protein LOC120942564 n=1 Tax=Rana temporaria TaxID=8407 RepID=UPI001AAD4897|nr:uncharacterized protein LOC120942564 [Rana temporaria]